MEAVARHFRRMELSDPTDAVPGAQLHCGSMNNRAENSHQPTRRRERWTWNFDSRDRCNDFSRPSLYPRDLKRPSHLASK